MLYPDKDLDISAISFVNDHHVNYYDRYREQVIEVLRERRIREEERERREEERRIREEEEMEREEEEMTQENQCEPEEQGTTVDE